jgi:hypothetical protein
MDAYTKVDFINSGIKVRLYDGFPWLNMQLSVKAAQTLSARLLAGLSGGVL